VLLTLRNQFSTTKDQRHRCQSRHHSRPRPVPSDRSSPCEKLPLSRWQAIRWPSQANKHLTDNGLEQTPGRISVTSDQSVRTNLHDPRRDSIRTLQLQLRHQFTCTAKRIRAVRERQATVAKSDHEIEKPKKKTKNRIADTKADTHGRKASRIVGPAVRAVKGSTTVRSTAYTDFVSTKIVVGPYRPVQATAKIYEQPEPHKERKILKAAAIRTCQDGARGSRDALKQGRTGAVCRSCFTRLLHYNRQLVVRQRPSRRTTRVHDARPRNAKLRSTRPKSRASSSSPTKAMHQRADKMGGLTTEPPKEGSGPGQAANGGRY